MDLAPLRRPMDPIKSLQAGRGLTEHALIPVFIAIVRIAAPASCGTAVSGNLGMIGTSV